MISDKFLMSNDADVTWLQAALAAKQLSGTASIIDEYERALATWFKSPFALATSSGTAALHAALHVLEIKSGDEVLVTPTASIPSLLPLLSFGAVPCFVDTAKGGFGFDTADLKRKINRRTRAAISVPMWGYPCEFSETFDILRNENIPVIEDAAQAHGASYEDTIVGTRGLIGCFSTHDRKALSTGEGGFLLTSDGEIYEKAKRYIRLGDMDGMHYGVNFKLSALQCSLGLARLPKLEAVVAKNRGLAFKLLQGLEGLPLQTVATPPNSEPNFYGLAMQCTSTKIDAKGLAEECAKRGIPSDVLRYGYRPAYKRPIFATETKPCPNAEALISELVTFPIHNGLTTADMEFIAQAVQEIFLSNDGTHGHRAVE